MLICSTQNEVQLLLKTAVGEGGEGGRGGREGRRDGKKRDGCRRGGEYIMASLQLD